MITEDCSGELTTYTGFRLDVRRARPEDETTLANFFTHVTPEDLRFRFLSGMKEVSHERLVTMTRADDRQTDNFLAFAQDGTLIAVAMLASDQALRTGEVAISIRADHKHKGVSWELLAHVARYAEARGIDAVESIESRDNHSAIELQREMGFTVKAYPDDPKLVSVRRQLGGRFRTGLPASPASTHSGKGGAENNVCAADLMATNVVTIRPDMAVSDIAKLLVEQRISALPVVNDESRLIGMVSEGDLLHREELGTQQRPRRWLEFFSNGTQLAGEYAKAHGRTAEDVMSRPVVTAKADAPLCEIVDLMEKHRIKRVPIVAEGGRLIGLVTRGNLVRALALRPRPQPATGLPDSQIRDLMLAELRRQPWGRNRDSDIVVTDGVVHIWGMVGSEEESLALVTVAKGMPGVRSVSDRTSVLGPYPYVMTI
jgi:CBS domain-containing protein